MIFWSSSEVGDDFDFDICAFGQGGNLDGGTRRKVGGKIFRIDLIHARKIRKIGQKDGAFYHIAKRRLLIVQNSLHVFENALGLGFDVAAHEITGRGIKRNLPGAEKQIANADGMVVGSDGWRGFGRFDDGFLWHKFLERRHSKRIEPTLKGEIRAARKNRRGVSPHFFRQHKPEKSAGLTPTPPPSLTNCAHEPAAGPRADSRTVKT